MTGVQVRLKKDKCQAELWASTDTKEIRHGLADIVHEQIPDLRDPVFKWYKHQTCIDPTTPKKFNTVRA